MKNLFIIPTDKPSRLVKQKYDTIDRLCLADMATKRAQYKRFNIYITSAEEIKEDWYLNTSSNTVHKSNGTEIFDYRKGHQVNFKIILTTDTTLITDGVQAIPDEFLEWFVKNPSCEEVEANKSYSGTYYIAFPYKIIIPKEEPEQHIELINDNIEEFDKSIELFKQETLEEAAESGWLNDNSMSAENKEGFENGFKEGAKWQMERSCEHNYILTAEHGHRIIECTKCNHSQAI